MNIIRNVRLRLLTTTILGVLAPMILVLSSHTAHAAVVYCKYIGVPKGCIVRPGVVFAPAPVVGAAVVATPGVGAPGVGVRYGTPANRGGPVNRVGRR